MPIDMLVVDSIHQFTNQEDTQAANPALFSGECDISLFLDGRIKRYARIINHYFQLMAV